MGEVVKTPTITGHCAACSAPIASAGEYGWCPRCAGVKVAPSETVAIPVKREIDRHAEALRRLAKR